MTDLNTTKGPKGFPTAARKTFIDFVNKQGPGPGAHSPERLDSIENPEWVIGTSNDRNSFTEAFRAKYPGPTDYNPHFQSTQSNPVKHAIPQYSPPKAPQLFTPIYCPDRSLSQPHYPTYTFGYSLDKNYETDAPGPGAYEVRSKVQVMNKTQKQFGVSQRPLPYGEEGCFPGPGKYLSIENARQTKNSFSKASRSNPKSKEPLGKFYDIRPHKKAPRMTGFFQIKQKKRQTSIGLHNNNPAPNHYTNFIPDKIPSGVIERSNRQPLEPVSIVKNPSPDKYSSHQPILRKGYSFTKQIRDLSVTDNMVPAPGKYEPMKTFSTIGGAIGKQCDKQYLLDTPGATDYMPKYKLTKARAQSTIVFQGDRSDFSKTITGPIGPGQYDIKNETHSGQLGKIGKSHKKDLYGNNKNPGVGNYDLPSFIGRLPKYYSSSKKMTQTGYSTFHEKLKVKIQERQRKKEIAKYQEQLQSMQKSQTISNSPDVKV